MVKVNSLIKLHILISLNSGQKHGYELIKELESKLSKKISASHIYPFLKELKKASYVVYQKHKREKIYKLTPPGKKFVHATLLKFHEIIQESIKEKIKKCTHCGCEIYNNKYSERINNKNLVFCCSHCAKSYKEHLKN